MTLFRENLHPSRSEGSFASLVFLSLVFPLLLLKILLLPRIVPNFWPPLGGNTLLLLLVLLFVRFRSPWKDRFFLFGGAAALGWFLAELLRFYPFFFAESLPVAFFIILNLGLPLTILCYGSYRLNGRGGIFLLGEVLLYELILFSRLRDQTVIFQLTAVIMTCLMFIFFSLLRAYRKQHARVQQLLESQEALNRELALASKALQEQEKRAALTAITAGLAHEIHNPINYLQGNLVFLEENLRRLGENQEDNRENRALIEDTQDILSSYRTGFSRIIQIIGGLKTLFDPGNSRETRISLRPLLQTIVDTLPVDQARRIDLTAVGDYSLSAAPGDLFSLFSILFQNSFEAMGQEGAITVAGEPAGRSLVIRVKDDGPGIDPEAGTRIFDSFFTTKNNNLGLGLPLAKKIVEKYGGTLSLRNLPARGCEVVLHVPDVH